MAKDSGGAAGDALPEATVAHVQNLSSAQRRKLAAYAAQGLSRPDRQALHGELERGLGTPRRSTADMLWVVVVVAFSIVLVGSFVTIALSVFVGARDSATVQTVLSLFTAVVGFLAGLFAPSPSTTPPGEISTQTTAPADATVHTDTDIHPPANGALPAPAAAGGTGATAAAGGATSG